MDDNRILPRKTIANLIFEVVLILLFAWLTWQTRGWPSETRLFPYAVGLVALLLSVVVFLQDLIGALRERRSPSEAAEPAEDTGLPDENSRAFVRRALEELAWVVGYCGAIGVLGFTAGSFVFLGAYFRIRGKIGWVPTVLWAIGSTLVIWLVFVKLASMRQFDSLIWMLWK